MEIYHNPRCRKSREALAILKENGIEPKIIEYLKEIPSKEQIAHLLMKLNIKAEQLLRKNEDLYKKQFKGKAFTNDEWIQIMIEHPRLIERPIVVKGNKAIIGRPPEAVKDLL